MPPKKRIEPKAGEDESMVGTSGTSVDDYLLPKSMIQRLAKGVLPPNTQIQKDALTALLKSTTVFVSYLANNANDRAVLGNHKTIKPEDVLEALKEMEFEQFVPRVTAEHDRYVEIQNTKRNDYRKRVKEDTAAGTDPGKEEAAPNDGQTNGDDRAADSPPAAKKPRISLTNGAYSGTTAEAPIGNETGEEEDSDGDDDNDDDVDDDMDGLDDVEENEDMDGDQESTAGQDEIEPEAELEDSYANERQRPGMNDTESEDDD